MRPRTISRLGLVAREWPLLVVAAAATAAMTGLASTWTSAVPGAWGVVSLLLGLCLIVLLGALAIVRHADVLAERLGEPGGTLLLTLAVTGLEAAMVGLVMSTGQEKPELARDTMFAVIMLVLNGYLGLALLLGGIRHSEQPYNPQSANAFLVLIIPLSVFSLVLPTFTHTTQGPTLSAYQMVFLSIISAGFYVIFLLVQNRWHRDFFIDQSSAAHHAHHDDSSMTTAAHGVLLAAYGAGVILVSKAISTPLDDLVLEVGAPPALAGFIMAMLVLTPESIAAVRAARANQLQRSINILLGSVLASIGLTVPIVILVALSTGRTLVLGLADVQILLLCLTLVVSILTFSRPRTNLLLGSVHLMLFAAAAMMIFDR